MEYLAAIFIAVVVIGLLANRELSHDKKRIRRMMREYSFKTYSPEDAEEKQHEEESQGKKM